MPVRTADAVWNGALRDGNGTMRVGSGAFEGPFTFATRFEEEPGTNPDELIGAALAGCFSMAFANILHQAGFSPRRVETSARVHLEGGVGITSIDLQTTGDVPEIDEATFREHAENAKQNCPVGKALRGTEIRLEARLAG